MVFNKKKFNIIVTFTILLICLVVAFSAVGINAKQSNKNPMEQLNAEDSTGEDIGGQDINDSDGAIDTSAMKELSSNFQNGYIAINYALSMMNKYDHKMTVSQSVLAEAAGQGGTQKLTKEIYKVSGASYAKIVADGSGVPLGLGENYTQYISVNNANGNIINKKGGANTTSESVASYLARTHVLETDIPYVLNQSTVKITDKTDPKKNYYEYYLVLNSGAWKNYVKYLAYTGGSGSNPSMNSITLTVRIDKQYGYFISISAIENYKINRGSFEAICDCSISMKFDFKNSYATKVNNIKSALGI